MNDNPNPAASPAELIRIEAAALTTLAHRLEGPQRPVFDAAVDALEATLRAGHRLTLTGIGKSGLIARKIAATLTSLSVPTPFLHPAEALHGDLGLLASGDALLALSYSGETEELLNLLPALQRLRITLLTFTGCAGSSLARQSAHTLDVSVDREACHHKLAPTASTTVMLALGDALAVTLSQRLGFAPQTFAELHPGGSLGRRLTPIRELMHIGDAIPTVSPGDAMPAIIHEMSAKRLGVTTVQSSGQLLGIISDGDLRRLFERSGPAAFQQNAATILHPNPHTVAPSLFAPEALDLMESHQITTLLITADGTPHTPVVGITHLHDLVQALSQNRP